MNAFSIYKIILDNIISFIFPNHCMLCGILMQSKKIICIECINKLPFKHKDKYIFCKYCGNLLVDEDAKCKCISNNSYYFDEMKAAFYYDDVMKYIIHQMKFDGRYRICFDIANIISFYYKDYIQEHDIIMSVPLNKIRIRDRGYNQSDIIAQVIAKKFIINFDNKSIKRIKNTKQLSKSKDIVARLDIIKDAFVIDKKYINTLKNKNILLIDDIFTTGTTVNELSKTISKNVNVNKINILAIAKA